MCGRFTNDITLAKIHALYSTHNLPAPATNMRAQFNNAQTQSVYFPHKDTDKLGVTSCTIITAPAVQHIAHIHTRMPVILDASSYEDWLDTNLQGKDAKVLLLDQ